MNTTFTQTDDEALPTQKDAVLHFLGMMAKIGLERREKIPHRYICARDKNDAEHFSQVAETVLFAEATVELLKNVQNHLRKNYTTWVYVGETAKDRKEIEQVYDTAWRALDITLSQAQGYLRSVPFVHRKLS